MVIGRNIWLKPVALEDAQLLADWEGDPKVLGDSFDVRPQTKDMQERRVENFLKKEPREGGLFIICSSKNDERVGEIGYIPFFNDHTVEVFYMVHPDFRNNGIATQAVCLLTNHLFMTTKVERVQGGPWVENPVSCRVLEKAGMQKEGIFRRFYALRGSYVDVCFWAIVREDWKDEQIYRKGVPEF